MSAAGRVDASTCQFPAPSGSDLVGGSYARVSPNLGAAYNDEVVTGIDYAPGWDAVIGAAYVYRRHGRAVYAAADGANTLVTNGFPGTIYIPPGTSPEEAALIRSANRYENPSPTYQALMLAAHKRFSHHFMAVASYTWAREGGASNEALLATAEMDALTRAHDFKAAAAIDWPIGSGAIVGGLRFRAQSGNAIEVRGTSPDGVVGAVHILPRGSGGRLPTLTSLDLHLGYRHLLPHGTRVELYGDVFNLFNQQQITAVDDIYTVDRVLPIPNGTYADLSQLRTVNGAVARISPNYGQPVAYQAGTSLRFGLRASF